MDINKVISELREYKVQLEQAISVLEGLARGQGQRRGRPPAWLSDTRKPRTFSDEARKRMAAAQRKRWASYRKGKAKDSR